MSDATLAEIVALVRADARPGPRIAAELESGASPATVLERVLAGTQDNGQQSLLAGHTTKAEANAATTDAHADPHRAIARATADLAAWKQAGIHVVSVLDPGYPTNLRAVHDRPPLIFTTDAPTRDDSHRDRAIAVIGSRRATPAGRERAAALAAHLIATGFTVVSGLAAGIDTAAHTAALKAGGGTIAVIGTGLRHAYPPENAALQRMIAQRGSVLSPFWPDTPPSRETFPLRNGVMSGVSLATVIVEAGQTSGARIQARLALAHGRPVFLAVALLEQAWARALADRPGVHAFRDPGDVTDAIQAQIATGALTD